MKISIVFFASLLYLLLWSPWLDNDAIHDEILFTRGRIDGSIQPIQFMEGREDLLQHSLNASRAMGIEDGILLCDYNVRWVPFGRWVASCEGGYYVTFFGKILS